MEKRDQASFQIMSQGTLVPPASQVLHLAYV